MDANVIIDPTPCLYCDNKGSVTWIHSEAVSCNMGHFNIRQCALRESVKHKEIVPVHMPGAINPSNLFTKETRGKGHFIQLRGSLMSASPDDVDGTQAEVQGGVDLA